MSLIIDETNERMNLTGLTPGWNPGTSVIDAIVWVARKVDRGDYSTFYSFDDGGDTTNAIVVQTGADGDTLTVYQGTNQLGTGRTIANDEWIAIWTKISDGSLTLKTWKEGESSWTTEINGASITNDDFDEFHLAYWHGAVEWFNGLEMYARIWYGENLTDGEAETEIGSADVQLGTNCKLEVDFELTASGTDESGEGNDLFPTGTPTFNALQQAPPYAGVKYVGAGAYANGTGSVTAALPSSAEDDDLLLIIVEGEGEDANADGLPTGYTQVGTVANDTAGSSWDTRCTVGYAIYDSGSPPSTTVPDAGDHTHAVVVAFRGIDTTSPFDVTYASGSSDASSSSHTAATSQTSSTDDAVSVIAVTHGDNTIPLVSVANSSLSGPAKLSENEHSTGSDGTIGVFGGVKETAGSIGSWTWSSDTNERDAWIAMVLKPGSSTSKTGSLDETLANATSTASGKVTKVGTLDETLANATSTASGKVVKVGTLAETLEDATSAASGEVTTIHTGSLAETLEDATSATSGTITKVGTLAETLADATSTADGVIGRSGSIAETLADATSTADGVVGRSGSVAVTLADATMSASGSAGKTGSLTETLDDATSTADGVVGRSGSSAETLADATSSADGVIARSGSVAETLDDATSTANGTIARSGSIAETLADATASADGVVTRVGSVAVTLADAASTADGTIVKAGSIAATLANATSSADGVIARSGSIAETLEDATSTANGTVSGTVTGSIAETLVDATSSADGVITRSGSIAETLDDFTSDASGTVGAVHTGSLAETLDSFTSVGSGDVTRVGSSAETLDDFTTTTSGVVARSGSAAETLDNFTSTASGTVTGGGESGELAETLADFTSTASGTVARTGVITETLEDATSTSTGTIGRSGTLTVTLADFTSEGGQPPIVDPDAKDKGVFYRNDSKSQLSFASRHNVSQYGWVNGWERVSDVFVYEIGTQNDVMALTASDWATHQGSDTATLKAAINTTLNAYGYRSPSGNKLT